MQIQQINLFFIEINRLLLLFIVGDALAFRLLLYAAIFAKGRTVCFNFRTNSGDSSVESI